MTMNRWRYTEYQGVNDGVAPHRGGYWIVVEDDLDLVARVWHDDQADTWFYDVTEGDEVEYDGTPCVRERAKTRDEAQVAVAAYFQLLITK